MPDQMIDAIKDYLPCAKNWDTLFGVEELPEGLAFRIFLCELVSN